MKKNFVFSIFLFLMVFLFPKIIFASDVLSHYSYGPSNFNLNSAYSRIIPFQPFIASSTNLSRLDFSAYKSNGSGNFKFVLCKGILDTEKAITYNVSCTGSGQAAVAEIDFLNLSVATTTSWQTIEFDNIIDLELGASYFFTFYETAGPNYTDTSFNFFGSDYVNNASSPAGKWYSPFDGKYYSFSTLTSYSNLSFRLYYDSQPTSVEIINPDFTDIVQIGSENVISLPVSIYCSASPCNIPINYSYDLNPGNIFYITLDQDDYRNKSLAVASSTLSGPLPLLRRENLSVATTTSFDFCVLVDKDVDELFCGYSLIYGSDTSFYSDLYTYDIESACDTVATSSGTYADDFRYGLECGFRKVGYWLIYPEDSIFQKFNDSKNAIQSGFPFSVVNQFRTELYNLFSVSSSTTLSIDPIIPDSINGTPIILSDSVIYSSEKLENGLSSVWDYIIQILHYFIWFIVGIYFSFRLFGLMRGEHLEEERK